MSEEVVYDSSNENKEQQLSDAYDKGRKDVAKDLQDKLNSLKALSTINDLLLRKGSFSFEYASVIQECAKFLQEIHGPLLADALNHSDADLVPELVDFKKNAQNMKE